MIALSKFERPDISSQNPKMFSKTLAPTIKFTTNRQLEKQPSSTSRSVREIDHSLVVKISQELVGCGTFGQCFLARYRNITAVVKEMKRQNNTSKESKRCKLEVLHEANILHSLGDHAGLPFLLGICTEREPYCLVLQFHGGRIQNMDGGPWTTPWTTHMDPVHGPPIWTRFMDHPTGTEFCRTRGKHRKHGGR